MARNYFFANLVLLQPLPYRALACTCDFSLNDKTGDLYYIDDVTDILELCTSRISCFFAFSRFSFPGNPIAMFTLQTFFSFDSLH